MALDIPQSTPVQTMRTEAATARPVRPRYLLLAMATGLLALGFGLWHFAPDSDSPVPNQPPATTIVAARITP